MAVRFDASLLYEGIWKAGDIAALFHIAPNTFSGNREKWLGLLRRHCDVEEIDKGNYYISNVK